MNKKITRDITAVLTALVLFILTASSSIISGTAENAYNWYCIRTPGNKRPPCPAEMLFVEKLGGFFIDKNKSILYNFFVIFKNTRGFDEHT